MGEGEGFYYCQFYFGAIWLWYKRTCIDSYPLRRAKGLMVIREGKLFRVGAFCSLLLD